MHRPYTENIPLFFNFSYADLPTPGRSVSFSVNNLVGMSSGFITVKPLGFTILVAIFAKYLLGAIPIEQVI